jgi:hypothetical protein
MYVNKAVYFRIQIEPYHIPVTNKNERLLDISKEVHLRVKLVSYEKNRPEVFSATFSSAENSISAFFCQIWCNKYEFQTGSGL